MEATGGRPIGRRIFLGMLGAGVAGTVWGSRLSDGFSRLFAPLNAVDPIGITELFPTSGGFRIYSVTGSLPRRAAADYELRITGLVDRPTTLRLADLQAMPPAALTRDFQCVTGWRVQDVDWRGVRLADLLERAGVSTGARAVRFRSFDGTYTESLTLPQAERPDVLVAYEMQGKPLSRAHGGPARLYVAPMYGYKSCKWLEEIEVTSRVIPGYWEGRGYDVDAWIGRSNGRDDEPAD